MRADAGRFGRGVGCGGVLPVMNARQASNTCQITDWHLLALGIVVQDTVNAINAAVHLSLIHI